MQVFLFNFSNYQISSPSLQYKSPLLVTCRDRQDPLPTKAFKKLPHYLEDTVTLLEMWIGKGRLGLRAKKNGNRTDFIS